MDTLSDVLSLLVPRTYGAGGFDMGKEWSLAFPQHPGFKCYAVVSGACWLAMQGVAEPLSLQAGDCFLLPQGRPFRLASDLALAPVLYSSLPRDGGVASDGKGGDCFIVGGHFALAERHRDILSNALPPIVRVREESDKAALRWSLERMRQELRDRQPGATLVARHLSHLILVQALRLHIAERPSAGRGWLTALADKRIGAAVGAIHADPGRRWTLRLLADEAGMSRSAFALRFRELVEESPIEYLTRWRMLVAAERLAASAEPMSVVARSLGYQSESSFSTAFKRVFGRSPRQHARDGAAAVSRDDTAERVVQLDHVGDHLAHAILRDPRRH